MRKVRFRTLGCYPLTAAIESNASSVKEIIEEMLITATSERQGRIIDKDHKVSMEMKNSKDISRYLGMNDNIGKPNTDLNQIFDQYAEQDLAHALLRFITCGSVDDGKSTLIGRLLYDSKKIFSDQLNQLKLDNTKHGKQKNSIDFAMLVDGLESEREQGITIDVAYRYFSTKREGL